MKRVKKIMKNHSQSRW